MYVPTQVIGKTIQKRRKENPIRNAIFYANHCKCVLTYYLWRQSRFEAKQAKGVKREFVNSDKTTHEKKN